MSKRRIVFAVAVAMIGLTVSAAMYSQQPPANGVESGSEGRQLRPHYRAAAVPARDRRRTQRGDL